MPPRPTLLVSACLCGEACRYDGQTARESARSPLVTLGARYRLVPVCPEEAGGLGTPRPPAQFATGDGDDALAGRATIRTTAGEDVTAGFVRGARHALERAQSERVVGALLKARSPSCGSSFTHSGGAVIEGRGVSAALLAQAGYAVRSEEDWARDADECVARWASGPDGAE